MMNVAVKYLTLKWAKVSEFTMNIPAGDVSSSYNWTSQLEETPLAAGPAH